LIIVDEAHFAVSDRWLQTLSHYKNSGSKSY
jgi:hypothetical protein